MLLKLNSSEQLITAPFSSSIMEQRIYFPESRSQRQSSISILCHHDTSLFKPSVNRDQTSLLIGLQELQKSVKLSFHALWNKIISVLFSAPLNQCLIFIVFN